METHYHIGFAIMSLIFVGQAAGFIVAAFFNNVLLSKMGRAKMLMASVAVMIIAYVILVCTPPYAAIIAS
jgi:MFS family permease